MNSLLKKKIFVLLFHIKQFKRVYKINSTLPKDLTKKSYLALKFGLKNSIIITQKLDEIPRLLKSLVQS
jgi:hypothetical protein